MTTSISVVFSLFLLLPGFIVIKIHQSTREYKTLDTFEYTTQSLAYSLLIFLIWVLSNYFLLKIFGNKYTLFTDLKEIIIKSNFDPIFSKAFGVIILSYLSSFLIVSLFLYNILWINLFYIIFRKIGFTRFSQKLTPWEDFQLISKFDWVSVELKNGKTIIGKLCFGSHSPFEKEIVLKAIKDNPIQVYNLNNELVKFGPEIERTYINYNEISNIHSIIDDTIETTNTGIKNHICLILSLLISIVLIFITFNSISLSFLNCISTFKSWIIILFLLMLLSFYWNLKTLSKYS